jgi:hypothetical protein
MPPINLTRRKGPLTMTLPIQSARFGVAFKAGSLPQVNPRRPHFMLDLDGLKITCAINPKAARKLATWEGGALLQGRLVVEGGFPALVDAGIQFFDPKPVEVEPVDPERNYLPGSRCWVSTASAEPVEIEVEAADKERNST